MSTTKGRELAWKLNPAIGTTTEIENICSRIARNAATHHRWMETACNRSLTDAEERTVDALERLITDLVNSLPETDAGPFVVEFQGDPRGCTVKLLAPPPWDNLYDGFAREAIIVPQ